MALINWPNRSFGDLKAAAKRSTRDHLLWAFALTFFRELVHRMTTANGSICSSRSWCLLNAANLLHTEKIRVRMRRLVIPRCRQGADKP